MPVGARSVELLNQGYGKFDLLRPNDWKRSPASVFSSPTTVIVVWPVYEFGTDHGDFEGLAVDEWTHKMGPQWGNRWNGVLRASSDEAQFVGERGDLRIVIDGIARRIPEDADLYVLKPGAQASPDNIAAIGTSAVPTSLRLD